MVEFLMQKLHIIKNKPLSKERNGIFNYCKSLYQINDCKYAKFMFCKYLFIV